MYKYEKNSLDTYRSQKYNDRAHLEKSSCWQKGRVLL